MFPHLSTEARQIIAQLYGLSDVEVVWVPPADPSHGDLATAVALKIAKGLGKKPQEIAQAIADAISLSPSVEHAAVAGAGYVNIRLTAGTLLSALDDVESALVPVAQQSDADPVIIEYSQPNVAKPLGAHHVIGTVVGQSLVNMYRHTGYSVISWNYMGDWGTQFGKLAVAYQKWGEGKPVPSMTIDDLLVLYVRFHDALVEDPALEDQGRETFAQLEKGDPTLRQFWKEVVAVTKASLGDVYRRLHVSFDLDLSESFYEHKMDVILQEGQQKHVFVEGEGGSLIVEFPEASGLPPYLVRKGDGATLYSTRDLAQMRYRMDTYQPQAIYILTDIAQKLHFEQLVATCEQLNWKLPTFENVLFGRMRFADKSMSTRKGNILHLEHVLDEAVKRASDIITERGDAIQAEDPQELAEMMGIGAVAYGILSQNRTMDIVFDWDRMLSFEGNSAPYLQYTHARARSVLRKAALVVDPVLPLVDALEPEDRELLLMLLRFPSVLRESRDSRMPHKLANYLYTLCQAFNTFYNVAPIVQASAPQRDLRLALTARTADILRTGASILTIRVPDRM